MFTCCSFSTEMVPGEGKSLLIEGEATFDHEQELYRAILDLLKSGSLELRCGSILQADYSFVMLICAAHRTAQFFGRQLTIREGLPKGVLQDLEQARQSREQGCIYSPGEQCLFWLSLCGAGEDEDPADDTEEFPAGDPEPAVAAPSARAARQRGRFSILPAVRARVPRARAG